MPDPEALARANIDRLLTEAGWTVVDRDQANIFAVRGVAIRVQGSDLDIAMDSLGQ